MMSCNFSSDGPYVFNLTKFSFRAKVVSNEIEIYIFVCSLVQV
jgi:hypothetical protein